MRGYFGIGIDNCKNPRNIGGLFRSAQAFGASFMFVIGERYKYQKSDTGKATLSIPLYEYKTFGHWRESIPKGSRVIGVEYFKPGMKTKSHELSSYFHPEQAIYLLGAEDEGISLDGILMCDSFVHIPSTYCLNVASAGSIIMYDRQVKALKGKP